MTKRIFSLMVLGIFLLGISSLVASAQNQSDKIKLQFQPKEGEVYNMQITVNQEMSQTVMGQNFDMTQAIQVKYTYKVEKVNADKTVSMITTFDSILFKLITPTGEMVYDSSDPSKSTAPDSLVAEFNALIGTSFTTIVAPDGSIKEIQGADLPDELEGLFGEMVGNQFLTYPDKPVGIGDSWTKQVSMSGLVIDVTSILSDRKNGIAFIDVDCIIKSDESFESGESKIYDISGKQTGKLVVEEVTGFPLHTEFVQEFSGKVKIEDESQAMDWLISVKTKVIIDVFDI